MVLEISTKMKQILAIIEHLYLIVRNVVVAILDIKIT